MTERLALHEPRVRIVDVPLQVRIERIGLDAALAHDAIELPWRLIRHGARQPQPDRERAAGGHLMAEVCRRFRALAVRADGCLAPVDHELVEGVLEGAAGLAREEPAAVGLVLGQEPLHPGRIRAARPAPIRSQGLFLGEETATVQAQVRLARSRLPAPGVAESELRQQVQRGRIGAAIVRCDAHQHVVDARLGVFDEHVEITVAFERSRVEQFILRRADAAAPVLGDQVRVGKSRLRILVEHLQVGMCRRRVEIVI